MTSEMLKGSVISISISSAPDMGKLGYPSREVDRVLLSVCGTLIRAGARIAYGGNLDPHGYTAKIFRHLAKAYAVRQSLPPFIHYIPETTLFNSDYEEVYNYLLQSRDVVEALIIYAGEVAGTLAALEDGNIGIRWANNFSRLRSDTPTLEIIDKAEIEFSLALTQIFGRSTLPVEALSQMRKIVSSSSSGRIVMGGKMGLLDVPTDHYQGTMPGLVEETILTLAEGKPVIVLGAFGGAARDIAIALGLMPDTERVVRGAQMASYQGAMESVARFRSQIPEDKLQQLKEIAVLDRSETIGYKIVELLRLD